jgi:hypothetical protein
MMRPPRNLDPEAEAFHHFLEPTIAHRIRRRCCIPCRSDHLDELAGIPPVLPKDFGFSFPASGVFLVEAFPTVEATPPHGWISSWSSPFGRPLRK